MLQLLNKRNNKSIIRFLDSALSLEIQISLALLKKGYFKFNPLVIPDNFLNYFAIYTLFDEDCTYSKRGF